MVKAAFTQMLLIGFLLGVPFAHAAPGDLDVTFGTGGKVITPIGSGRDWGHEVVVQSDGKIVVAGESYNGGNVDFALTRYNADGSLDTSFNGTGKITTDIGGSDRGYSVVVQSDGKIVVAGYSETSTNSAFALLRYNADGSLDTSFGAEGKAITPFGGSSAYGYSVALQSDDKIVVAGGIDGDFAVLRYMSTGALDTNFGTGGKVTADMGGSYDYAQSVALQSDGKIVVAGDGNFDFALLRCNADGSLDTSFGDAGKVTTPIGSSSDYGRSLAVQSDGKILVTGYSNFIGDSYESIVLVRYLSTGALDASFGVGGKVTTAIGFEDGGGSVVVQSNGKILVAGYSETTTNSNFALLRYNSDGSLDTSFGAGGKAITPFGSNRAYGSSLAVQSDGKIVVAGGSGPYLGNPDFALVRYEGDIVAPSLTIRKSTGSVTLTLAWPSSVTGFSLEQTDTLPAVSWTPVSPAPVVVEGENVVTTPASGAAAIFRLRKP